MKIHMYDITFFTKEKAHTLAQYGVKQNIIP